MAIILFIGSSIESAVMEASRYGITGTEAGVSRADKVLEIVADRTYGLLDMDQVDMETLVYESFADIGKPEPFTDQDGNAVYNAGEPFVDVNGNGQWDADMGEAGLGGPSDVVVYRLTYDWGIITPVMREIIGESVTPRLEHRRAQRAVLRRTADATPPHPPPRATARHRGDRVRADPADPGACSAPGRSSTAG